MKYRPAVPLLILCLALLAPMHVHAEAPAAWSTEASAGLSAHALEETARAHLDREIPDLEQAALWLHAAAEAGSGSAMAHLAYFYQQGYGVARQGDRAVYWYERAVAAGELQHTLSLGWAYLRGEPVARDRERAEDWFRQGIEAGFHPARIALASVLIADALGGLSPERALEAEELLINALPREPVLASYFLARLYLEGIGHVPHDPARGLHFTRLGAERGDVRLQGWLGRMYANGEGLEPDLSEAVKWANLSAAGGDPYGKRLRLQLEAGLSPEVVEEGRRRAVEWAIRDDG
ncbi:hypothetical protein B1C78_12175 [Thioalkalivibrio denitrificans]|uniref:Sel1 repeat family protein n=1 Tax=Thioalkalivibrio denitrificans TaxID=108003 RepID=A0A1V3NDN0_9GAMM|nr:tetratricopeptide repeat protein [Thioalkalivibrio denitrificans]OOG23145.1 hypothetical protein B1C78_12175 [Thioalkalivibrio denitrificans]